MSELLKVVTAENDDGSPFEVAFELAPAMELQAFAEKSGYQREREAIREQEAEVDLLLKDIEEKIDKLNRNIDVLTNHADWLDYTVAVASGVLTGLLDSFFVGATFNFDRKGSTDVSKWRIDIDKSAAHEKVNRFVEGFARLNGFKGDRLQDAIAFLEKKFPVAQDNSWKGKGFGVGTKNHHLADFAHHPTILGLGAAILSEFLRMGIFVNRDGEWHFTFEETSAKELMKIWWPILLSGVLLWLVNIAQSYNEKHDRSIPKPILKLAKALAAAPMAIKILMVAYNWVGHLVSDMAGSKQSAGDGMGIPGLFISLLQEIASMPLLKETGLPQVVNDLYTKQKIDLRTEVAIFDKQKWPIIINELLVRTFYFVRYLVEELRLHNNQLRELNWRKVVPIGNRTVERMMTIASGTFVAVDMADAAIRSWMEKTTVDPYTFAANMLMRVNFVGVGRFVIAIGVDVGMGIRKEKLRNRRIGLMNEMLHLRAAKVFYKQANLNYVMAETFDAQTTQWEAAEETVITLEKAYQTTEEAVRDLGDHLAEISKSMANISRYRAGIQEKNPKDLKNAIALLRFGEHGRKLMK